MKALIGKAPHLPLWKLFNMSEEEIKKFNRKFLKEVEMSDISHCNTKEGMHLTAKEKGLNPWTLGCSCLDCCNEFNKEVKMRECLCDQPIFKENNNCITCGLPLRAEFKMSDKEGGYCSKCNTVWSSPGICNCSAVDRYQSVLAKEIWNAAIEAAACECDGGEYPDRIRKLKK